MKCNVYTERHDHKSIYAHIFIFSKVFAWRILGTEWLRLEQLGEFDLVCKGVFFYTFLFTWFLFLIFPISHYIFCFLLKNLKYSIKYHPTYLTYMQGTSCEMLGWMKYKLESRLLWEISVTSDMQVIPPLWQKVKN